MRCILPSQELKIWAIRGKHTTNLYMAPMKGSDIYVYPFFIWSAPLDAPLSTGATLCIHCWADDSWDIIVDQIVLMKLVLRLQNCCLRKSKELSCYVFHLDANSIFQCATEILNSKYNAYNTPSLTEWIIFILIVMCRYLWGKKVWQAFYNSIGPKSLICV